MKDVEPFLALARETFGNEPDAVNLWIGDDRSLSAVHKDHYEVRSWRGRGGFFFWRLGVTLTVFGTSLGLHSLIAAARPGGAGFERAVFSGGIISQAAGGRSLV